MDLPIRLPHPNGYSAVAASVNWRGEVIRLFVENKSVKSRFAMLAAQGFAIPSATELEKVPDQLVITEKPYSALLIHTHQAGGSSELQLASLTATCPLVEQLSNGEALVVERRAWRYPDGTHDLNARVYDQAGTLQHEFLLGDGISDLQVDATGLIWVSYTDEGIFGNLGWRSPIGAAGLCCFTADGTKVWEFQPPSGFDHICDCYALNVSSDAAWAYYYSEFSMVRIDREWNIQGWRSKLNGASALAIRGNHVLLYGGYGDRRTGCQLVELGEADAELVAEVSLALPEELNLAKATVIARDAHLHLIAGDDWYRFSLESSV